MQEVNEDSTVYREYIEHRRPWRGADGFLEWWHAALLSYVERDFGTVRGRDVLEIGFGHGYFARAVRAAGGRYRAMDMSEALVKEGQAQGFDVVRGRMPQLPDALRASADVLWMSHVLEHARDWSEARAMVSAALDALRPGGMLVVVAPDAIDWGVEFWNGDWNHGYPTTARRCVQLLHDCGTSTVRSEFHRAARFDLGSRALVALFARMFPYRVFDRVLRRSPDPDTGFGYSFMSVFGWRQILVTGRRPG